jgi:uncharacterized protein (DUF983 family)
MANDAAAPRKDACPRCGKPVGLTFWNLLPSRERDRVLTCKACGGHYDLTNASKMASVLSGMAGMAVGMLFPFQWIVRAGHGSRLFVFAGIAVAAMCVGVAAAAGARLMLGLESKP